MENPLRWLNLIISEPFYFSHFLAFFSYIAIRLSTTQIISNDHLFQREIQTLLAFLVLIVIKIVREESWEAFVGDAIFLAKGSLVVVTLVVDYHLTLCYLVGFSVIFIITQQPSYPGLGNSSKLTPLQLEVLLSEGNTSRFWLVEFRASSSTCTRASRFFPDLSVTYSNKNISFGIVDFSLFPNAADMFGISLGVGMSHLPTYILYENGVEATRFPEADFEAKGSRRPVTKRFLCQHFELDQHLIKYVHFR